jgi:hypothetical protein
MPVRSHKEAMAILEKYRQKTAFSAEQLAEDAAELATENSEAKPETEETQETTAAETEAIEAGTEVKPEPEKKKVGRPSTKAVEPQKEE